MKKKTLRNMQVVNKKSIINYKILYLIFVCFFVVTINI